MKIEKLTAKEAAIAWANGIDPREIVDCRGFHCVEFHNRSIIFNENNEPYHIEQKTENKIRKSLSLEETIACNSVEIECPENVGIGKGVYKNKHFASRMGNNSWHMYDVAVFKAAIDMKWPIYKIN